MSAKDAGRKVHYLRQEIRLPGMVRVKRLVLDAMGRTSAKFDSSVLFVTDIKLPFLSRATLPTCTIKLS